MSELRKEMIRAIELWNLSNHSKKAYLDPVNLSRKIVLNFFYERIKKTLDNLSRPNLVCEACSVKREASEVLGRVICSLP